ncbi:hypothetical protein G6F68_015942 [Rhizopus microsporus]|nr:hypothetical protein G6F68_015942 [Rhizopus microsporus]
MIREGVKAVSTINRDLESQRKISIQVFTPNEVGTGVRYDEYDSIVSEQAAEIVLRSISHSVFKSTYPNSTSTLNSNHASVIQSSSIINTPTTVTAQALPSSVEPNTFIANYNVSQAKPNPVGQYHRSSTAPTSMQYQALLQPHSSSSSSSNQLYLSY